MTAKNYPTAEDFFKKNETLNKAKTILKKEFFGIDEIIDRLVNSISAWYLFPHLQMRPRIINLWGLTGVGKTSLLRRLIELIGKSNDCLLFEMGEPRGGGILSFYDQITSIQLGAVNRPVIYIFDEFQFAKTIDHDGHEITHNSSRIIWEILGNGFFYLWDYKKLEIIEDLYMKFKVAISKGVKADKGLIVKGENIYQRVFSEDIIYSDKKGSPKYFYPEEYLSDLFNLVKDKFKNSLDLHNLLLTFNETETLDYLKKVLREHNPQIKVDCTNALIFIVGNLDEAYLINDNFNPDVSADEFYKFSKKINILTIKDALLKRFRSEQIARLGNTHLIYPSLNTGAYKNIINAELDKIAAKYSVNFGIKLTFDESLRDLIYREGVIPTLGARQVFSTIENIITSNIPSIYYEQKLNRLHVDKFNLSTDKNFLIVDFIEDNRTVHTLKIKLHLSVENLRKAENNDRTAVVSVHESGHAITSALLLNKIPQKILAFAAVPDTEGMTVFEWDDELIPRNSVVKRLAVYLAGYAAEKIVFGEDFVTTGSGSDLLKATRFASQMFKRYGLGSIQAYFENEHTGETLTLFDNDYRLNSEIRKLLGDAMQLAEKTLSENKSLLLHTADSLRKNGFVKKENFIRLLNEYSAYTFDENLLYKKSATGYYSSMLDEQLSSEKLKLAN